MREIVLDTETTGLDPGSGHRVVEIGCVELVNHLPTGHEFHRYLDPERDMPAEAFAVHGLSGEFLRGKPRFAEIAQEFATFIADARLVIHNAEFDLRFLNAEFTRCGLPTLDPSSAVDTVAMARRKFPGAQASLDALCRRFEIDLSARDKHGALLDAQLLAEVYLELIGGRQPDLELVAERDTLVVDTARQRERRTPRRDLPGGAPTAAEEAAHAAFLDKLSEPIWRS
jgi:DNA polymerase-3 subunit epsilon